MRTSGVRRPGVRATSGGERRRRHTGEPKSRCDDVDAELGDLLQEGMSESSCEEDDYEGNPEGPPRAPSPVVDSAQGGNVRGGGFESPTATLTAGQRTGAPQTHVIGGQAVDPYGMMRDELRALERMAADYDATNRVECTDYGEYLLPEIDGTLDHVDVAGCIDLESIRDAVRNHHHHHHHQVLNM